MQFDKKQWFKRVLRNKHDPDWHKRYVTALAHVVEWVEHRGYEVDFNSRERCAWLLPNKTILVPSAIPAVRQLMYLLHEAGHVAIECSKPTQRFKRGYLADRRKHKQLDHLVDILDEELEAWDRGWRLACALGIRLNEARWNKLKVACIKKYMLSAVTWGLKQKSSRTK